MNKQNKLARNAIRARKAQIKRANEQDKPKKGKRWLTRLFALVGCLLLVSALVVPCVADAKPSFSTFIPSGYRLAYENFYARLAEEFFNLGYFVGGSLDVASSRPLGNFRGDVGIFAQGPDIRNPCYVTFAYDGVNPVNPSVPYVVQCSLDYELWSDFGDNDFVVTVFCRDFFEGTLFFTVNYICTIEDADFGYMIHATVGGVTSDYFDDGAPLDPSKFYVGIASSFSNSAVEYVSFLLLGNYTTSYSPRLYSTMIDYVNDGGYLEGYNDGYNTAVGEIDSGDFGRNFLGRMFNAPLEALNGFVLVELPMGEGVAPLSITLGSLIYLIVGISISIWLLKMLAGG